MKVKCLLAVLLLSATATAFAQEAKYGIKSAILKKEAVTMGQKVQGVQYFDATPPTFIVSSDASFLP